MRSESVCDKASYREAPLLKILQGTEKGTNLLINILVIFYKTLTPIYGCQVIMNQFLGTPKEQSPVAREIKLDHIKYLG